MNDSTTQTEETLSAKEQYEAAIEKSDHVPQSTIIGEFVLDALINASGESSKIRELRFQIKSAIDSGNDDEAFTLMNELKTIKDAEQESASALAEISSKFSVSQILSSFKADPAFEEIVYGLALKILNQTHTALTTPMGKVKTQRAPKESQSVKPNSYTVTKGEETVVVTMTRGITKLSNDKAFFELLGFTIVTDEAGKEALQPEKITRFDGSERNANKREMIEALHSGAAFEGVTITTN